MRSSKLFILFAVLLAACAPLAIHGQKKDKNKAPVVTLEATPVTPYSNVRRDNLLNGLQVITLDRPADSAGNAMVKCDIVVRAGAMFDLVGKTGLAALTQASLLAANPRLKEELESLQAKIDWGINWDTTWFHIETPANNFDAVFEIVARLLVVENARPDAFKAAQQEQINRVKTRQLGPAERADEAFLKAIYGDHPYGHNLDGTEVMVAGIRPGDVYDFLKRFYIANNVSVSVVGPISQERVMRGFKVFFGGWSKGQIVPATFRQPAQVAQLKVVKVEALEAANVELRGGVLGVRHTDPDFLVTEVMARILSTRLGRETDAGGFSVQAARRVLSGPFYFAASLPAEKAPQFSQKATEQFAALAARAVSAEELAAAKSALAGEYVAHPIEHYLREIEVFGFPRNHPLTVQSRIDAISAADVQRVARRLLDANALTVVALGRVNEGFKTNP